MDEIVVGGKGTQWAVWVACCSVWEPPSGKPEVCNSEVGSDHSHALRCLPLTCALQLRWDASCLALVFSLSIKEVPLQEGVCCVFDPLPFSGTLSKVLPHSLTSKFRSSKLPHPKQNVLWGALPAFLNSGQEHSLKLLFVNCSSATRGAVSPTWGFKRIEIQGIYLHALPFSLGCLDPLELVNNDEGFSICICS